MLPQESLEGDHQVALLPSGASIFVMSYLKGVRSIPMHLCLRQLVKLSCNPLSPLPTFQFSLIFIMSTGKEQTIIGSIHLFSIVLNISNVCYWKKDICSLVNLLENSPWPPTRAPNSLLQLTWIIVGNVRSMVSQMSNIKIVFNRLFRHL